MLTHCHVCKKKLDLQPWRLKRSKKFFCSKECKLNKEKKCIRCKKEIDHSKKPNYKCYCQYCYNYIYRSQNQYKDEYWKNKNRLNQRKKKNIPIDLPLLKKPKGTGYKKKNGYIQVVSHGHPNANKKGKLMEHWLIMTEHLGRPLKNGEFVHHLNGIRDDNRIENLELWNRSHPPGQRVEDRIKFYIEFLDQYGYDVVKRSDSTN